MEKRNKVFFVLFALVMLFSFAGLVQLRVNPDLMIFMPNKSLSKTSFDDMNRVFENGDEVLIMLNTRRDTLDGKTTDMIVALNDSLSALSGISYIMGPVMEGELIDQQLFDELSTLKLHQGEWQVFFTLYSDSAISRKSIDHIETLLAGTEMSYHLTGTAYLQKRLVEYILKILCYLPFIAIFLVIIVFRLQMRSMKATFMSVLPAIVGAVITLGVAGWSGKEVSIVTSIAPIFTLVIGSANGLHFVSHYMEAIGKGKNKKDAVCTTLDFVGVPMIITSVTSMGGFLSLLVMDMDVVWELAIFTSSGIAAAGIATWFVLPLLFINKVNFKPEDIIPARIKGAGLKKLWGLPSLLILALVVLAGTAGAPHVRTDFNQLSMFKKSTDVVQSALAITEVQGGSMPVYIFIRHETDILDPALKSAVQSMCDSLTAYAKVISPYDIIDELLNQPMFRMMRYFSPERTILSDLLQQKDMPLKHMIDLDEQALKIIVIPRELTTSDLVEMRRIVDSVQPEGAAMAITGMSYIMEDLNQNMITNLKNTLIASTVVMFILLFITFGGVFPVLISLVPILTTTWFLYGFLGISGLSLTLLTAVVFSISIGIGIDYAIHLSSVALKLGDIEKAFDYAARPIMANALGLALGMTALVWTPLSIHLDVSIMTWVSMLLSMFLSLTLLPTMLRGYFKWRTKKTTGTS